MQPDLPPPTEPIRDATFERLKADVQEGIRAANAGDVASVDEVRRRFGLDHDKRTPKAS